MPARDHRLMPFAAALLAIAVLSLMDATMKSASLAIGAYSTLLLRSFLNLAIIGPVWLAIRPEGPASSDAPSVVRLHITRGLVLTFMGLTFFWGLARLPLAEALALSFIAPLIALFLAALLLGETVERRAIHATLLGLAGVVLIALTRLEHSADPATDHPEAALGIAAILVSALLYAWNLVLQRQQAQVAAPAEVAAWQNLMVGLVLVLAAPWFLTWPDRSAWLMIAISGALSLTGAMLFAWAYRRAEAQALVPLEYTGFAWAALFGWLFFAETVRASVLAGAALIIVSCWLAAPRRRPEQSVV